MENIAKMALFQNDIIEHFRKYGMNFNDSSVIAADIAHIVFSSDIVKDKIKEIYVDNLPEDI